MSARNSRPRSRRAAWGGLAALAIAGITIVAPSGTSIPAGAVPSPSQQWATSAAAPTSPGEIGGTRTISFGTSGVTAVETTTATTSATQCIMGTAAAVGSPANIATFLEPDPPTTVASMSMGCFANRPDGAARTFTITFNKPLVMPNFHPVNLDASNLTVTGTSTTGDPITLTPLAKNDALEIVGNTLNSTLQSASSAGCRTNTGGSPNGGCGSIQLGADSGLIESVTLVNSTIGSTLGAGFNDGWGYLLSFPTAPLTKAFSPTTITQGETSELTFSITNPDDPTQPTLSDLEFTDALPAGLTIADSTVVADDTCGPATVTGPGGVPLAEGATSLSAADITVVPGETCTITVNVTADEIGTYTNDSDNLTTAVGNLVPNASATLVVEEMPPASISLLKSASPSDVASFVVGQEITYSFLITNTGEVALADPQVEEGVFSGSAPLPPVTCPPTPSLAPDAQVTCTTTYTITQADLDEGSLSNDATANALPPVGPRVESAVAAATILGVQSPALTVTKSASTETVTAAGEEITYSFLVTNTGNVTLADVAVVEGAFSGTGALPPPVCPDAAQSLAPDASVTCTTSYTVTAADVTASTLSNTATATGTPPDETEITSTPSTAELPVDPPPPALATSGTEPSAVLVGGALLLLTLGGVGLFVARRARRNA